MAVYDPRQALEEARKRNSVRPSAPSVTTFQQAMSNPYSRTGGQVNNNELITLANKTFTDSQRRNQAQIVAQGGEPDVGGWRGLVGDVLGNKVVQTVLKPLEILDIPRRVAISGIHEISDAVGSGDASWDDFMTQAKDPSYGVGRYVNTGNKWIDRALGFIGDVALDPLTYASFGANHLAGQAGRFEMARKAIDIGLGAERAGEIAKFGRAAMTADELGRMGLNRSGVYFFGKRLPSVRVPGTGAIGEVSEKALSHLRVAASETSIGTLAQKAFTPNVNREARLALARGDVAGDQAERYIRLVTSRNSQRVTTARATEVNAKKLEAILPHIDPQARHTLYEALDGTRAVETLSPAEKVAYDNVTKFLADGHGEVQAAVATVDPSAKFGYIEDGYFPWMRSDQAQRYMGSPSSPFISDLKKGFDDGDPLGVFQHRSIAQKVKKGEKVNWFGTQLKVEDLNIKRLNELARKGGFDGDFFETDVVKVLDKYGRQQAQQMGLLARYGDLKAAGVFEEFDTRIKDVTVVDKSAVEAHKRALAELNDDFDRMTQELGNTLDGTVKLMRGRQEALGDRITRVGEITDAARQTRVDTQGIMIQTQAELKKAQETLARQYDAMHSLFRGEIPVSAQPIADELRQVSTELNEFNNMFGALMAQAESGVVINKATRQALEERASTLSNRVAELTTARNRAMEFNDLISKQFEQIASGKMTKDASMNMLGRAIGSLPETDGSRKAFGRMFATQGEMDKWIKSEIGKLEWHGRVNSVEKIAPSSVSSLNSEKVMEIISEAAGGGRAMGDVRAAAMWQLARDDKFYAQLPEELKGLRDDLTAVMEEADKADSTLRRIGTTEIRGRKTIEVETRSQELERVLSMAEQDLKTLKLMDDALATGVADGDMVLDDAMRASLQDARDELAAKTYMVGQGAGAKHFQLEDFQSGRVDRYVSQIQGAVAANNVNLRELRVAPAKTREQLGIALAKYQLASEVQYRMALTTQMLAPFGLVPGEGMMRSVINSVAKNHAEHWTNRVSQLTTTKAAVEAMREEFGKRWGQATALYGNSAGTSGVLRDVIREAFDGPDGNAIRGVLGPIIGNAEDPTEMLRMMRPKNPNRSADIEQIIKPWWRENYGKWVSLDAAKAKLKEATALGKTPFAANATSRDVDEFFTSILGGQLRGPAQLQRQGGRTVAESASWMRSVPGTIDEQIMTSVQAEQLFRAAADPNVDVHAFLLAPGVAQDVPSFYATTLRNAADNLERVQGANASKFEKLAPGMDPRKGLIGDDPKWVKQVRKDADLLQRRQNSVMYTIAQMDEEMHTAMMDLAHVDGWKIVDPEGNAGFLTENGDRIAFTREEWDSLYKSPDAPSYKELNSEQGTLLNDLKRMGAERERLESGLRYAPKGRGELNAKAALRQLDEDMYDAQTRLAQVRREMVVAQPETQQMALEKMRQLVHGADDETMRQFATSPGSHAVDAAIVNERRAGQAAAHARGESRQFLDEIEALQNSANIKAYRGWLREGDAVAAHAAKLRDAAASVEMRSADAAALRGVDTSALGQVAEAAAAPSALVNQDLPGMARQAAAGLDQVAPPSELRAVRSGPQVEDVVNRLEVAQTEQPMIRDLLKSAKKETSKVEKQAEAAKNALTQKLESLSTRQRGLVEALDDAVERELGEPIYKTIDGRKQLVGYKDGLRGGAEASRRSTKQLEGTLQDAASRYQSARVIGQSADDVQKRIVPEMEKRLADYTEALNGAPKLKMGKKGWNRDQLQELGGWARSARIAIDAGRRNPDDPVAKLLLSASKQEGDLVMKQMEINQAKNVLKAIEQGTPAQDVWRGVRDGLTDLKELGLPGLQSNPDIANMLVNMQKVEQPAFAREVNRLMGGQLRFFKAYATLSPGFHVRNTIGNTFMTLAAGGDPRAMGRGFKLYKQMREFTRNGATVEEWLAQLPADVRPLATVAADAMSGVGSGRTTEQLEGMLQRGSKINDNKVLRVSQRVGHTAESAAHFMLGFDSAVKGMDSGMATARVKRFLFDYQDISAADENMKSIIPFWLWMSRNLPLQVVNQWANPKMYQIYGSFVRNFSEEDNSVVPKWMRDAGAFRLSGDTYATPDFGFNRLEETLAQVGNPTQLLSYVNPLLRVPAELYAGKQFYNDIPISETPQPLAAGPLSGVLGPIADLLGKTQTNADGERVVDPRLNYALKNLFPPLAQAQRLLPSEGTNKQNQGNAWLGYAGIPIRNVTESDRKGELYRRQKEIEAMADAARRLGYAP